MPATGSDATGTFTTSLDIPNLPLGPYVITAECGPTLAVNVDLAVATSANSDTGTLGVFVFFLLLVLMLFRRRRLVRAHWGPEDPEVE